MVMGATDWPANLPVDLPDSMHTTGNVQHSAHAAGSVVPRARTELPVPLCAAQSVPAASPATAAALPPVHGGW